MAKVESFKCDNCGTIKGQTNCWFIAIVNPKAPAIELWEWSDAAAEQSMRGLPAPKEDGDANN